jgi:hypothetical protein
MALLSYLIVLIVLSAGVLAYLGWRHWAISRSQAGQPRWRNTLTLAALVFLSAAILLFIGYAGHNAMVGGDRNGSALTLLCIRSGNYSSAGAILLSLGGKGPGRWLAFAGGCFILLL